MRLKHVRTLKPGERGTKALLRRYGDRLLMVRYRYDARLRRRLKTVELIVDEVPWEPPDHAPVRVRLRYREQVLRGRVKAAGGHWNAEKKVWELPYGAVRALALEDRLVREAVALYAAERSVPAETQAGAGTNE